MSKKDEEISKLVNEKETLKARIANLEEENKQLRLRSRGLDQKLRKLKLETDDTINSKTKEVENLKDKIILVGKQAERVMDSKNREIEKLGSLVKERSFAIKSSQPLDFPSHSVVHGAILSEDSISVGDNVMVDGHLDSGGSLLIGAQTTIKGVARATRDITIRDESEVKGDVESGGSVFLGSRTHVGSVRSEGSVDVGEKSHVMKVMARGDVILGNGARIEGGISYGGSVSIGKQTSVKGTIEFYEDSDTDDELFEDEKKDDSLVEEEDWGEEKVLPPPKKSPQSKMIKPESSSSKRGLSCPICGTPVSPGSKKCPGCGSLIREVSDNHSPAKEEDVDIPKRTERRSPTRKRKR